MNSCVQSQFRPNEMFRSLGKIPSFLRSRWTSSLPLRRVFSSDSSKPDESKKQLISAFKWRGVLLQSAFLTISGGGLYWYFQQEKEKHRQQAAPVQSVGRATLGGPFSLVDGDGVRVTDTGFRGKFLFLYFGFTMCPDICPAELEKMAKIINLVEKDVGPDVLQPVFISVDPRRDTPTRVKKYCSQFHPKLIGLTGSIEDIVSVTKAYRVYFSKPAEDEGDDDYLVDHSIIMYLMDRDGNFVDYYGKNFSAEESASKIVQHIRRIDGKRS